MLNLLWRLLLSIGFLALLLVFGALGLWNQQLVTLHTPYGDETMMVFLLVLGAFAAGLLLMLLLMSFANISEGLRARRAERELRAQLAEKEKLLNETDLRLADYEAKAREFTLQVMQITHALGTPVNPPPGLALPTRSDPHSPSDGS